MARLPSNPADYVKLPTEHSVSGAPGTVDNPAQFLTAQQVTSLVAATPWPYNVYVLAAWAGLRAAELCGLQVGDVDLPQASAGPPQPNPRRPAGSPQRAPTGRLGGLPTAEDQGQPTPGAVDGGDDRPVARLPSRHPRGGEPTAPLFPAMAWLGPRKRSADTPNVDWLNPLRHSNFYQSVLCPPWCALA